MNKLQVLFCSVLLMSASISQSIDIFREISQCRYRAVNNWIKSKPNLLIRDQQGQSILHAAVLTGRKNMVSLVLQYRVDINALDNHGKTALDLAIESASTKEDTKIILMLLSKHGRVTSSTNALYAKDVVETKSYHYFIGAVCTFFLLPTLIPVVLVIIAVSWHNYALDMDIMMPGKDYSYQDYPVVTTAI